MALRMLVRGAGEEAHARRRETRKSGPQRTFCPAQSRGAEPEAKDSWLWSQRSLGFDTTEQSSMLRPCAL
ncbi:MAG TPA: hypothetical protein DIC50_01930 [Verrucomicrobia subdivision 3 bacterium]|nr:hypothetical protein [Limisphaerales bacterium]